MEQLPTNYANSKIYTIRSHQTQLFYIGSTRDELRKRLHSHKKCYDRWTKGGYHYVSSFDIIKYDDHYIELLENYPCENKNELTRREGQLIRENMVNVVNKNIAGRTNQEIQIEKKDIYNTSKKNWRENNKAKIKAHYAEIKEELKQLNSVIHICECGGKYTRQNKTRHLNTEKHLDYLMIQTL
jgi:hypothetical protein